MSYSPTDMLLKDDVASSYEDSLTAGVANGVDWEAAEVVKTHKQDGDGLKIEDSGNIPGMGI